MMYYLLSSRCGLWSAAKDLDVFPKWEDEIKATSGSVREICDLANHPKNEGAVVASSVGRVMWELYASGTWANEHASI